ncbi:MAG: 30S ribosomal protein S12 methylthiotransferase RimO [Candidatus Poribacteria bacterium]
MAKRIALISLGCPKNLVDSEVMLGLLRQGGYELTSDEQRADIVIINTCAFIESAKQESIDAIIACSERVNHREIVVTGCLAQRYSDELVEALPEVSAFVGTGEFHQIVKICDLLTETATSKNRKPLILVSPPRYLYDHLTPRVLSTPKHYAYLKIAEGCDNKCSFCVIPQVRGVHRSRSLDSLLAEAHHLAESGVRELVLISQDSTSYGMDLKGREGLTGKRLLPKLLKNLTRIDGIEWIRVLYAYPTSVDEELLDVMLTEEKVCAYLDIPIQHIHDDILRRMVRKTTSTQLHEKIALIKRKSPDMTLRSTVIVGFPGETQEHFNALLGFIKEVEFDHLGVFAYSREEGTPAARMKEQVLEEVKQERVERLVEIQKRIAFRKRRSCIGKEMSVLLDGFDENDGIMYARTEGQAPEIDDVVYISPPTEVGHPAAYSGKISIGEFVPVRIVGTYEYDFIGEVLT